MGLIGRLSAFLRRLFQLLLIMSGRVPGHVAFVMDGNRRYAEQQHVDKATGHTHGYGKARRVNWSQAVTHRHNGFALHSWAFLLSAPTLPPGMLANGVARGRVQTTTFFSPDDLTTICLYVVPTAGTAHFQDPSSQPAATEVELHILGSTVVTPPTSMSLPVRTMRHSVPLPTPPRWWR